MNGLVCGDAVTDIRVRHKGEIVDDEIAGAFEVSDGAAGTWTCWRRPNRQLHVCLLRCCRRYPKAKLPVPAAAQGGIAANHAARAVLTDSKDSISRQD